MGSVGNATRFTMTLIYGNLLWSIPTSEMFNNHNGGLLDPTVFHHGHVNVDVDLFDSLNNDVPFDEQLWVDFEQTSMEEELPASSGLDTSLVEVEVEAEAEGKEADFVPGSVSSPSTTFPETFFMNPFAVSFPGDIPCHSSISITDSSTATTPSMTWSTTPKTATPHLSQETSMLKAATCAPSLVNTPASLPRSRLTRPLAADASRTGETSVSSSFASSAAPAKVMKTTPNPPAVQHTQIHFVDMADKKGAQRIRNTMNSRKHRQNKLDKIRELEKRLAGLEEEKGKWRERAEGLGWKQA
ncbi:hypothetical protein LTS17_004362 [Exophiala oligosperma]